jgi:hypothetical protein
MVPLDDKLVWYRLDDVEITFYLAEEFLPVRLFLALRRKGNLSFYEVSEEMSIIWTPINPAGRGVVDQNLRLFAEKLLKMRLWH